MPHPLKVLSSEQETFATVAHPVNITGSPLGFCDLAQLPHNRCCQSWDVTIVSSSEVSFEQGEQKNHWETSLGSKVGVAVVSIPQRSASLGLVWHDAQAHYPYGARHWEGPSDVQMPQHQRLPGMLENWKEIPGFDCLVVESFQVHKTPPIDERHHHQLLAVPWTPRNLWPVFSCLEPVFVFLLGAGLKDVKPRLIHCDH